MPGPIVFITGARGFIGRHVAQACAGAGATVVGLGHGAWSPLESAPWGIAAWLNGDISASNLTQLRKTNGAPDLLIHLAGGSTVGAAIAQPREDFFRTVATTVELLEWLRLESPSTALVAVSSAAVYGAGHDGAIEEEARLRPYSPYGHHKLMMESLCRSYGATYGLRSIVARLFSVYGAGLTKQLLWDACTRLQGGSTTLRLGGSGGELRDWVHVDDVARVLPRLADHATDLVPTVNVGSGTGTPVRDIAAHLATSWASTTADCAQAELEFSGESRPGDPFSLVADVSALARLGLACERPVQGGLAEYVSWFKHFGEARA